MRLVDADELLKAIRTDIMGGLNYERFIREAPTVDAEPARHGHWVGIDDEPCETFECDRCGYIADINAMPYNFCPECGAKMDEEKR